LAGFGGDSPVWADGPNADFLEAASVAPEPADDSTLSLWPDEPGLADRLSAARFCAEEAAGADQRSRHALYAALGHAHDFAVAAQDAPEDYTELLADAGIKVQERAPMTPVVKLVFGAHYDKTRLTEFAAALSWAKREGIPAGTFAQHIEAHDGGLKSIVVAERAARRPGPKPDRWADLRARLHAARPLARVDIQVAGDEEFVLLVARRDGDGLAILAPVTDAKAVEHAIRKSAA
jgi:hypothetical protein